MNISGTTQLLGIIGDPVGHSLSPTMHNRAIAVMGLDFAYIPFRVAPQNLADAIAGLTALGVVGFNATIPHKQAILPFLAEISAGAKAVGAVNTVWRNDAGWAGTNTDVDGFVAPLQNLDRDWSQQKALILGYGGAARAVVVGCDRLGVKEIGIIGRNPDKLQQFLSSWDAANLNTPLRGYLWGNLTEALPYANLLVNATPIGMEPEVDRSPVEAANLATLPIDAIAYDLIYNPRPTQFLALAQKQGAIAIDGTQMLVRQGAAALEIWLRRSVPVEEMQAALEEKLANKK